MKFCLSLIVLFASLSAHAEVVLVDKDGYKFSFAGFAETDVMHDSTRSFTEIMGNRAVAAPGTLAGENGRTQFSIRNSRLAFKLVTPALNDWKTLGYIEFDLNGLDATTTSSEATLYTSPTVRLRHGYLQLEKNNWQILVGQYWQLFGWQPYYFSRPLMRLLCRR